MSLLVRLCWWTSAASRFQPELRSVWFQRLGKPICFAGAAKGHERRRLVGDHARRHIRIAPHFGAVEVDDRGVVASHACIQRRDERWIRHVKLPSEIGGCYRNRGTAVEMAEGYLRGKPCRCGGGQDHHDALI